MVSDENLDFFKNLRTLHLGHQHAIQTEEDPETSGPHEPRLHQQAQEAPERRGSAGGSHHHGIHSDEHPPGHLGKVGMRHNHLKRNQSFCPTADLEELWPSVGERTREACG